MGDRPREPVDIAGLERGDLTERVPVEFPELDDVRARRLQGRERGRSESRIAAPVKRTGWLRGAPRFTVEPLGAERLLAGRRGRRAGRGVVGPEGPGSVEAAGDRARRPWLGRPVRAPSRRAVCVAGSGAPGRTDLELLVSPVDLGHLPGRGTRRDRIGTGHVRVVHAGQLPPHGLDGGLRSPRRDTQDGVWILLRHGPSVTSVGA